MTDDADRTPTRRFRSRRTTGKTTYSITRKAAKPEKQEITVVGGGNELEPQLDGQTVRTKKSDARRLLATLLEVFG